VSLGLCLAVCGLWVYGLSTSEDRVLLRVVTEAGDSVSLWCGRDGLTVQKTYFPTPGDGGGSGFHQALGFQYIKLPGDNFNFVEFSVPYWFCALALAAWPGAAVWRRARAGKRADLCPACGYDLRATPDRCPECGRAPA
jgi:hypothetical protein